MLSLVSSSLLVKIFLISSLNVAHVLPNFYLFETIMNVTKIILKYFCEFCLMELGVGVTTNM